MIKTKDVDLGYSLMLTIKGLSRFIGQRLHVMIIEYYPTIRENVAN